MNFFGNIFQFIRSNKKIDKEIKKNNSKNNTSVEEVLYGASGIKKIYKKTTDPTDIDSSEFNSNIDEHIKTIIRAKEIDGYVARVCANLRSKSIKNGYKFKSKNKKNSEIFQDYLENILINSGSSTELFLQELIVNFGDYSNVFIHKTIDPITEKIEKLTILPSIGWTPKEAYGTKVTAWEFDNGNETLNYTEKNILHLTFNKEIHHVFGTPIIYPALEDAAILRDLESSNAQEYYDSLDKRMFFYVGDVNNPAKQNELDEVSERINDISSEQDFVLSGHIRTELKGPEYSGKGLDVIEKYKTRVLSAMRSSSTNVGEQGAGRQDAETLDSQEEVVIEDLQQSLANQLNVSIIRQLCLDCFGKVDAENQVKIIFNPLFTTKEREEKHIVYKYLSSLITIDEAREMLGMTELFEEDRLYTLMMKKEGTGLEEASNRTNPENQHGKKGNSKESKKN